MKTEAAIVVGALLIGGWKLALFAIVFLASVYIVGSALPEPKDDDIIAW